MPVFPFENLNDDNLGFGLEKIVNQHLLNAGGSTRPIILHMLGVPGVGKSTIAKAIHEALYLNAGIDFSLLAFDQIMLEMPAYQNQKEITKAFEEYEIPARHAGYVLLKKLLDKKASIIFDHSGADELHVELLRYCSQNLGYKIAIIQVNCNLDVAKKRIKQRGLSQKRHTPLEYIDSRYKIIKKLLPQYQAIANLLLMFDTTDDNGNDINELRGKVCEFVRLCQDN